MVYVFAQVYATRKVLTGRFPLGSTHPDVGL